MKTNKVIEKDFTSTIEKMKDNSLNFEHSSIFTPYVSDDTNMGGESILGLMLQDNIIIDKIIPYLKKTSSYKSYSTDQAELYRQRPMQLSKDEYGCIDYWYIILAVNGYSSPYDFKDFSKLIIPKTSEIEDLYNKELYKSKTIGIDNI